MPDDNDILLRQIAIDVAVIKTQFEANEKLNLAARVSTLEQKASELTGSKLLLGWLITTGIALYAAWKP